MEELKAQLLHSLTGKAWGNVGAVPHHGINLPLSSLHSALSCGIGEFYDLIPMIDWCKKLKLDVIQLLPLNNSEGDPSPYNAISSCAINFVYLSLHKLPYLSKLPQLQKKITEMRSLNSTAQISYVEVHTHKFCWLSAYVDAVGERIIKSKHFKIFIKKNAWVKKYALYKSLKEKLAHTPWTSWPKEMQSPLSEELYTLYQKECLFFEVQQFLCHQQLIKIKAYANKQGIYLMGDIPILISRESVDVWENPNYFNLSYSAGAPPDYYNPKGQNWGFPIFEWDALKRDEFSWWIQRLQYAENFYDIFRIDHVIGFFRIWAIPLHYPPEQGCFIPSCEAEWEIQGRQLLEMLARATAMLPIAEDLGTVPDVVRPILKEFGICSTKVMRWEKFWEEDKRFVPLQYYPPISLTTLSTHDSETTAHWWKKFPDEAKAFADYKRWEYSPAITFEQQKEILWDSHHTSSLFHINLLQEYLSLYPELVHTLPEEERINIPGVVLPSNWTYRFKPSVEEITSHKDLFSSMEKIIHAPSPNYAEKT